MKFRCQLGHMVNQGPSDVETSKEFKYGEEILPIATGRSERIKINKSVVLSTGSPKALKRE